MFDSEKFERKYYGKNKNKFKINKLFHLCFLFYLKSKSLKKF